MTIVEKAHKVVDSCITLDQYKTALNWLDRLIQEYAGSLQPLSFEYVELHHMRNWLRDYIFSIEADLC